MNREPLESTLIRSAGYDPSGSVLEVEFVDGGAIYVYFDVPYSVYEELLEAESKGTHFNDFIRDLYAYRQVY